MAKQIKNGKAFEFALINSFRERLKDKTNVIIRDNDQLHTAKKFFSAFTEKEQGIYNLNASFAVNFLIDLEPNLLEGINNSDILHLELVSDAEGQLGDVRDVLAIRNSSGWEIGVSAKNNHKAVKHSRLSKHIDFGLKWMGIPCSNNYFKKIIPIFDGLDKIKVESNGKRLWSSLGNYHTSVYLPILNAFLDELYLLDQMNPGKVARLLVEYLIGKKDFYKVIKGKNSVEIQAYNLHGTLNAPSKNNKPKFKVTRLKMPNRIIEIALAKNSKTTLIVTLDEGWQISFRIHNASSRVESSLKFDINLLSSPRTLFTNHLKLS